MSIRTLLGLPETTTKLIAKRRARMKLARRYRNQFENATELYANGLIDEDEAIAMIQQGSAITFKDRQQNREQEILQKILMLTLIDGIDIKLAKLLISEYGTIDAIARATIEDISSVGEVDQNTAQYIIDQLQELI